MRRQYCILAFALFAFSIFISDISFAQPGPPARAPIWNNPGPNPPGPPPPPDPPLPPQQVPVPPDWTDLPRKEDLPAREILEQVLIARIAKHLKLDDEQTVLLVKKFSEFRDRLEEKNRERNILANEIRKMIKGEKKDDTQSIIEEKFNQLKELDREIQEQKFTLIEEISKEYPNPVKIELYLLLSDFENEVKRFLRKAYEWRQGRPESEREHTPPGLGRRFKKSGPEPIESLPQ